MSKDLVYQKISQLRGLFMNTDRFQSLENEFNRLLEIRRTLSNTEVLHEARGLVVIGESGSGKTTSLRRLFDRHPNLVLESADCTKAEVISLSIPSPATPKHVGLACLTALGYPLRRDRTASIIWELVHHHLKMRETLFLHFDEAQDFTNNRSQNDQQAVINTIKSLSQNRNWPVGVILSGMPILKELVNHDPQLSRRMIPIEFTRLDPKVDLEMVFATLMEYARSAELALTDDLKKRQFVVRLMHASAYQFGIMTELIIDAIENVLENGGTELSSLGFICAFRRRSGAMDGLNPFIADDFEMINARKLFGEGI